MIEKKIHQISKIIRDGAIFLPILVNINTNAFEISAITASMAIFSNKLNDVISKQQTDNATEFVQQLKDRYEEIFKKISKLEDNDYEYVDKVLLPIAFRNAKKEEEREKIKYIINGIAVSIDNKIFEKDIALMFYDILNQLRMIDIKILEDLYYRENLNIQFSEEAINKEDSASTINYILYKLSRFSLININESLSHLGGQDEGLIDKNNIKISNFGGKFIRFYFDRKSEK